MKQVRTPGRRALGAALAASALLAGGCAIEWQNREPARQLEKASRPAGTVYGGWRVFQARCASCHGPDAAGMVGGGPNLLGRVAELGERRFVGLVLDRYDWGLPPQQADRKAVVDDVIAGRQGLVTMPAWAGEPMVTAHIADLYAYLSARAAGTVAPGHPAQP